MFTLINLFQCSNLVPRCNFTWNRFSLYKSSTYEICSNVPQFLGYVGFQNKNRSSELCSHRLIKAKLMQPKKSRTYLYIPLFLWNIGTTAYFLLLLLLLLFIYLYISSTYNSTLPLNFLKNTSFSHNTSSFNLEQPRNIGTKLSFF